MSVYFNSASASLLLFFVLWQPTSSGEQMERFKKAASAKQLRRVSSLELPACVVVKSGDAADAGEVLQVRGRGDGKGQGIYTKHMPQNTLVESMLGSAFSGRLLAWACRSERWHSWSSTVSVVLSPQAMLARTVISSRFYWGIPSPFHHPNSVFFFSASLGVFQCPLTMLQPGERIPGTISLSQWSIDRQMHAIVRSSGVEGLGIHRSDFRQSREASGSWCSPKPI